MPAWSTEQVFQDGQDYIEKPCHENQSINKLAEFKEKKKLGMQRFCDRLLPACYKIFYSKSRTQTQL